VKQILDFADGRFADHCYRCGVHPTTREHVPPKVLLDEPYPANMPVVGACAACNEGYSLDEEYFGCLLEVAACGTAQPAMLVRPKIRRKLADNAPLRSRLEAALGADGFISIEEIRVRRVLEKVAAGLWSFESGNRGSEWPVSTWYAPLADLEPEIHEKFLKLPASGMWPEVGSRMMLRIVTDGSAGFGETWQSVQDGRFAYAILVDPASIAVRMITRGFLAAEVRFGPTQ
jgi:hypothetical protein